MEEKRILILAHNETKQRLNNEILMLRKIMSPEQQKSLIDQKHWQHLNVTLEEELVNAHIANDNLKVFVMIVVALVVLECCIGDEIEMMLMMMMMIQMMMINKGGHDGML